MALGREQEPHTIPIYIHRAPVERVNSFRSTLAKTWSGQLAQLESVARIVNGQPLLAQEERMLWNMHCLLHSLLYGSSYKQRMMRAAHCIIGSEFPSMQDLHIQRSRRTAWSIIKDPNCPRQQESVFTPIMQTSIRAAEIRRSRLRVSNSNTADSWTQNNWSCCCLDFPYPHSQCAIDVQCTLFHVFIILGLFLSLYLHPTTVVNKRYCNWAVELEEASVSVLCFPYCCSTSIPEGLHLL